MHSAVGAEHKRAVLRFGRLRLGRTVRALRGLFCHILNGRSALNTELIPSYQALTAIYAKHNFYPFILSPF